MHSVKTERERSNDQSVEGSMFIHSNYASPIIRKDRKKIELYKKLNTKMEKFKFKLELESQKDPEFINVFMQQLMPNLNTN